MPPTPIVVNNPFLEDISLSDDDIEGTGIEEANPGGTGRSEVKRQREKNRRKAIATAYGELASFIVQLDPELGDEDQQSNKKRRKSGDGDKASGISQVNVVGLALKLMKRLHSENEENKRILKAMQDRREHDFNNEKVLVMVPTLNPVDSDHYRSYPNAVSSYCQKPPQNFPDYNMPAMHNQRPQPYYPPTNNFGQGYGGPPRTSSTMMMSQQFYPQGVQYR